jgi:hypothetical protein
VRVDERDPVGAEVFTEEDMEEVLVSTEAGQKKVKNHGRNL